MLVIFFILCIEVRIGYIILLSEFINKGFEDIVFVVLGFLFRFILISVYI